MGRERFDRMSPERRDKLFESAAAEFGEHGYERASLNRIIERAGIGKSSLYYYFEDKRDLFGQLVQRVFQHFVQDIGGFDYRALTAETFWPEIERLFLKGVAFSESNAWYIRVGQLFYRFRNHEKGTGQRLMAAAESWVASVLRHGMTLGVVRTDLPDGLLIHAVMALVEACDQYFLDTWHQQEQTGRRVLVAQQMELLKRVCMPVT